MRTPAITIVAYAGLRTLVQGLQAGRQGTEQEQSQDEHDDASVHAGPVYLIFFRSDFRLWTAWTQRHQGPGDDGLSFEAAGPVTSQTREIHRHSPLWLKAPRRSNRSRRVA